MSNNLLDCLIAAAEEDLIKNQIKSGHTDDPQFLQERYENREKKETILGSVVHSGDTDSSDDESNRNYENAKYSEYGTQIKYLLQCAKTAKPEQSSDPSWKSKAKTQSGTTKSFENIFSDPIFGIRIIKPLVSSQMLVQRMDGRQAVPMERIRRFVETLQPNVDWVVGGVLIHKVAKTSQKGNDFLIWNLSDLHGDLKTISLFLFGSAYKDMWKCSIGTVIAVLNPKVFDSKNSKNEVTLSIDNSERIMIMGQSKDLGFCKSMKKNGEKCTTFVNKNKCEFCIYHVKQEYRKCSKRSELQSSFSGRGLTELRNKVLGKNEVFYAGKSYTAIPASKSKKLLEQDDRRLNMLKGISVSSKNIKRAKDSGKKQMAARLEITAKQRMKDMELLKKLGASSTSNSLKKDEICEKKEGADSMIQFSSEVTLKQSKSVALDVISKLKKKIVKSSEPPPKCANKESEVQPNFLDEDNLSDLDFDLSDNENQEINMFSKPATLSKAQTNLPLNNQNLLKIHKSKNISEIDKPSVPSTAQKPEISSKNSSINHNLFRKDSTIPKSRDNYTFGIPFLSGSNNKEIDLTSPINKRHIDKAKLNALSWIERNGPIKKVDPNSVSNKGKKRSAEIVEKINPKLRKIEENEFFSQRFKKMMAATSKHANLLEQYDNEQKEKYFDKMETKERMEEKMMTTYKINCKAVRCLQCKYTNFSASDRCKTERHPLKVFDAIKRFFKCGDCGNRTVALTIVPTLSCKNCGSGKWERTTMMKEKTVNSNNLSIRGGEQKFVNSAATDINVNLLVPDD